MEGDPPPPLKGVVFFVVAVKCHSGKQYVVQVSGGYKLVIGIESQ